MSEARIPRVLHAYKVYPPYKGGIPLIIKQIAEGLKKEVYQEVLSTHAKCFSEKDNINGIHVKRLGSFGQLLSLPMTLHYPIALWKLAPQFDIVDYHFPMPWVDITASLYWPSRTKLIIHWHSDIITQTKMARVLRPSIYRCLKKASSIVVSDQTFIEQSSFLKDFQEKCKVIPFGIASEQWSHLNAIEQQKVEQIRARYKRFVLAVGRLVPYKGFSVLISAMQQVDPLCSLLIVGRGPLEKELRMHAKKLQLEDRIHFFDKVNQQSLKCLYHAADIFVLPSIHESETFGMVQLEAMACAKPIINTQLNSAVPKVARHYQEALTVPKNSPIALAQAINLILQDSQLAQKLGMQGFERVQTFYSEQRFLAETYEHYCSEFNK